jgi:ABC-type glycerol-3-phosphate transport system substrate-binding protein
VRNRLEAFTDRNPDVRLEVRVKAVSGTGGLLSSLTAAASAAPQALPDLVALPRQDMETAALRGLIFPLDALTSAMAFEDWFGYARALSRLDTATFGLPFVGDALILVYRQTVVSEPPADLAAALGIREPLSFAAASPSGLFPLALYQATGAAIQDEEGRPMLEAEPLTRVLEFFQSGERTGLTPVWLTQYESTELAYQAFRENRAHLAVIWITQYLADPPDDAAPALLPVPDGDPFTLSTGWLWTLANPDPETHSQSIRLAEFLSESEFLGQFSQAAGYIPPREGALDTWPASGFTTLVAQLSESARITPPANQLSILGPAVGGAVVQVLKGQSEAAAAAQAAIQSLGGP